MINWESLAGKASSIKMVRMIEMGAPIAQTGWRPVGLLVCLPQVFYPCTMKPRRWRVIPWVPPHEWVNVSCAGQSAVKWLVLPLAVPQSSVDIVICYILPVLWTRSSCYGIMGTMAAWCYGGSLAVMCVWPTLTGWYWLHPVLGKSKHCLKPNRLCKYVMPYCLVYVYFVLHYLF